MGELLSSFTYPRNALGRSSQLSAEKALEVIGRARAGDLRKVNGSVKDEPFNDGRALLGIVRGGPSNPEVTELGTKFEMLCARSNVGAWQWLLTRSLWLYSVPNGTQAAANSVAEGLTVQFNFFDMLVRLCVTASSLPAPANILFFDELLALLSDDSNWGIQSNALYTKLLESRPDYFDGNPGAHRVLLGDLEEEFNLGRDNANTVFVKAFGQTGMFDMVKNGENSVVGMRLDPSLYNSNVLSRRLRFVLDNPRLWNSGGRV